MLIENLAVLTSENTNGQHISTILQIDPEHPLFKGHFPNNPIVPGVVLLQMLKEQAERFSGNQLQMFKASNVKFVSAISPEEENKIRLETDFMDTNGLLTGSSKIFSKDKICTKARLFFSPV